MQNAWMLQGGGQDLLNEFLKGYNTYMIPAGYEFAFALPSVECEFCCASTSLVLSPLGARRFTLRFRTKSAAPKTDFCLGPGRDPCTAAKGSSAHTSWSGCF